MPTLDANIIAARFSVGSFVFISSVQINTAAQIIKGKTPREILYPKIIANATPGNAKWASGPAVADIFFDNIKDPMYPATAPIDVPLIVVRISCSLLIVCKLVSSIFLGGVYTFPYWVRKVAAGSLRS